MEKSSPREKIFLGIALAILGIIFVFGKPSSPTVKSAHTFKDEPVEAQGFEKEEEDKEISIPQRIIIPELSIDTEVKKARIIDSYWEVFPDTAGWGEGSGLPGQPGNQVIFAHVRENLFLPLKEIEIDTMVYVLTSDGWFDYQVEEIKEVFPDQTEVIAQTNDETLTLYTCSGFNDQKRLIVVAKRTR